MTTRMTNRLPPRVVRGIRTGWVTLAVFILINWIPRIVTRFGGIPPGDGFGILSTLLEVMVFAAFGGVALFLYWRRGDDWLALFTGMMLLLTAFGYTGDRMTGTFWAYMSFPLVALMETFQVTFFYVFPNGRFLPSWAKYGVVPLYIFRFLIWENIYRNDLPQGALEVGIVVLLLLIGVGLQVYRYRKQATPVERQQVKWLLVGFTATIILVAPSVYVLSIFTEEFSPLRAPVFILRTLALLIVPVSIGISVTRYRLWDLDLTINRSVVGGVVTVVLAMVFGAVLFVTQAVLTAAIGEHPAAYAVILAAIVIGLLFDPTRRRVRRYIDRQLYRFRFDLNDLRAVQKPPEVKRPGELTGQTIGEYQVLDALGRGGMGEVYKGFGKERTVALKIMPGEVARDPANVRRFDREIEALRRLEHPNIIRLYDSGIVDGRRYMVIDYIEGKNLLTHLREREVLTPAEAQSIIRQVADALIYLHANKQIHRDVTSTNIMLRPRDNGEPPHAILMDFGIVKLLENAAPITQMGEVMGTIEYMAPEQIMQTATVDHRADIYGLATVYFELLTGRLPYQGSAAQLLFAHLYQPTPNPQQFRPDLPPGLCDALMRGLAKDPNERFESVAAFVSAAGVV